jgi:polyisoprenoid-binding protein YceI
MPPESLQQENVMILLRPLSLVVCAIGLTAHIGRAQQRPEGPPPGGAGGPPGARPPIRPAPPERVHLIVAPQGNEARYRVREQLATFDFPSDAVGATQSVTGGLLVDSQGKIVADSSRFEIDLRTLASNETRRDRFIQRNTLKSDSFPQVVFVPTAVKDLSHAPTSVPASFQLAGDLTIHGVTRPATWDVTVKSAGQDVVGTATTAFAFGDFGLEIPRLSILLSVKDTIRLEYDFHLVRGS